MPMSFPFMALFRAKVYLRLNLENNPTLAFDMI